MNQHKHVGHFGCGELTEMRKYGVDWRPYCLKCDRWLDPPEVSEEQFVDPNQPVEPSPTTVAAFTEVAAAEEKTKKFSGVADMKAGMTTLNRKEKKDVRPEEPEDAA